MANAKYTIETFTASDGYVSKYRRYTARGDVRGHIIYLHGIQSHAGWYDMSCERLAEAGYTVNFLDRRGSGMNETDRGDAPNFRRLLDDVAEFIPSVCGSDAPIYMIAVSWGGKIAVALQRMHHGLIHGMALLCPGICPKVGMSFGERLSVVRARLLSPTKTFPIPLNDPKLFTANPEKQQFLRDDPLALHEATARFLTISARIDAYLRFTPKHVDVPVLVMLAGQDQIIDNDRTRKYIERFASKSVTIHDYPEAQHTLEFESEDQFVADLIQWLNKRTENFGNEEKSE